MNIILNLTIKRRWFDMIASGEKREEYRERWNLQVLNTFDRFTHRSLGDDAVMILRNGYRMDSPAIAVRAVRLEFRFWTVHPEWGEPTDRTHFAIMLGDVLVRGTYAEVKEGLVESEGKREF